LKSRKHHYVCVGNFTYLGDLILTLYIIALIHYVYSLWLYYCFLNTQLLDSVIKDEEKRLEDTAVIQRVLEHDYFLTSLFACSIEIVLKSYDSQKYVNFMAT